MLVENRRNCGEQLETGTVAMETKPPGRGCLPTGGPRCCTCLSLLDMADPNRLTAADLHVGGRYLHVHGSFIRTIESIERGMIRWHDQNGPGMCSIEAFLKVCQSLAPAIQGLDPEQGQRTKYPAPQGEFTLRNEANALTAFAFRNGFLEDLHAGKDSPLLEAMASRTW